MRKLLLVLMIVIAACGGSTGPDPSSPFVTDDPVTTTVSASTAAVVPAGSDLVALCGAVELPVTDEPQLPSEPLDADALAALGEAVQSVGEEMEIFDFYNWFVAERSTDRLVLFGTAIDIDEVEVPYADAVLVRTGDGWRPTNWGQCHIQTTAPQFGNATWVLDAEPLAQATELSVLINERNCANGKPPLGRQIRPVIVTTADHTTITVLVEPISGEATCPSNPWHPITIDLGEALGDRALRDGSTIPPVERVYPPEYGDF